MKNYILIALSIIWLTGCDSSKIDTSYELTAEDYAKIRGYGAKDASLLSLEQQNRFSYTPETKHALGNLPFSTNPHIHNARSYEGDDSLTASKSK